MKLAHELGYAFNDFPLNEHAAGIEKSWQIAREFYEGRPPVNQMMWGDAIRSEIGKSVGRKANYQFPKQAMSGTSPVTIVVATKWSRGGNGEYPVRFVVAEWPPVRGQMDRFSRYMQVDDGTHDSYFIYGHYFPRFEDAMNDLTRSLRENNQDFSVNSVAHIPGMDFNDYEKKAMSVVGRRVSKSSGMGIKYDVYLKGRIVDRVFFDDSSMGVVKKILVKEGYDPSIVVAKGR